ncbi:MAG: hypothetical protein WDO16_18150 [Bacteroidota bacterium]
MALYSTTTGSGNTAIGRQTMESNSTGSNNTALGALANITGNVSNATAIGFGATASQSNSIQLGDVNVTTVRTSGNLIVQGGKVSYEAAMVRNRKNWLCS